MSSTPLAITAPLELLEPPHELRLALTRDLQREERADEVEQVLVQVGPPGFRVGDGVVDVADVRVVDLAGLGTDVRAVHGEAAEHLAEGIVQLMPRVIAMPPVPLCHLGQQRRQSVEIASQRLREHEAPRLARQLGIVHPLSDEVGVDVRQRGLPVAVDEEPPDQLEEVIARRALDGPPLAEPLARLQDLLDDDPRPGRRCAQPLEVLLRVPQAIGVVDAQALHALRFDPAQHEPVSVPEHPLALGPQPGQGVHVEEAPVADVAAGCSPEGEAVVLALEELVQGVRIGVETLDEVVDRARSGRLLAKGRGQQAAGDLLVAVPAVDTRVVRVRGGWQVGEHVGDEREALRPGPGGGLCEERVERAWGHGKRVVGVADLESSLGMVEPQLARLQHPAVVVAEDGHEDHVAQPLLGRVPLDIEVARVAARLPVLEHVPPPRVLRPRDRHVVGHQVDDMAQAVLAQRRDQPPVTLRTPQLAVHAPRIHDVIAVPAAGCRLQVRRGVDVADAERGKVAGDACERVEPGVRRQLDAVGRPQRGPAQVNRHGAAP